MNRRTALASVGSLGLAGLAGCLDMVGLAKHEATPAGVDPSVRDSTGYTQTAIDDLEITREIDLGITSEKIVVTNYLTKHEKSVDMGPLGDQRAALFTVLSTPQVEILGKSRNPVAEYSAEKLVSLVAKNYDEISDISKEESKSVTILDQSTTVTTFVANATFNGHDVEVDLHVSEAVSTDDDLLVTIGVYPRKAAQIEEGNIQDLMKNVIADLPSQNESGGKNNTGENSSNS